MHKLPTQLRQLLPTDLPFMREMLYQSLFATPGDAPFPRNILELPEIKHYVEDFGRPNDFGLLATHAQTQQPLGAVWLRLFAENERGYGYIDATTPELCCLCVDKPPRGRGIGTQLFLAALAWASQHHHAVSLSCAPQNPALRLYERYGFLVTDYVGTSYTLLRVFTR